MDWEEHDRMERALFEEKSLTALIALIEAGRELEFSYRETEGFISCAGSQKYASLWIGGQEQSFASVEALVCRAMLPQGTFASLWDEIDIKTLF